MNTNNHAENNVEMQDAENTKQNREKRFDATGAVVGENVHFQKTLQSTINAGLEDITTQARRYKDNPLNSQAGYVAESDHCAAFNTRKALERDTARAVREANGNHGDYKIVKGDKVLVEGEVKYHGSAEKTETAMRGYGDKQLVGPSDQVDEIKTIAHKKTAQGKASAKASRQKVGQEHEAVLENASDTITDGKTKSTPRTRKEAKKIARKATKGKVNSADVMPPTLGESLRLAAFSGAKSGAVTGALFSGVISGAQNMTAWCDGEKSGEDAFIDTATDITVGAIDSGVKGAAASTATVLATHALPRVASPVMKTVLGSSAPAAIAIGAVEIGKSAIDFATGEIDGEEFCEKAVRTGATTGGAWAGAEAGGLLGTFFGPPGIVVGSVVGGMLGYFGMDSLFD